MRHTLRHVAAPIERLPFDMTPEVTMLLQTLLHAVTEAKYRPIRSPQRHDGDARGHFTHIDAAKRRTAILAQADLFHNRPYREAIANATNGVVSLRRLAPRYRQEILDHGGILYSLPVIIETIGEERFSEYR